MRKIALLFACAAIACATPSTPFEGHPVLVGIDFVGNDHIKSGELRDKIATQATSGFFTKTVRYYDADLFAIDQKRILRWYNEKGFYEAKITNVEEKTDSDGRVTVVVHIDEGRRARVQSMQFAGAQPLSKGELNDIEGALPLHVNDAFDEGVYEKSKDVLQDQLREHGFAEARVDGKVRIDPENGTARIVYDLKPGSRYVFGKVEVNGNRVVDSGRIERAAGINPGNPFKPSTLDLAQQRVYNLGVFSGARVLLNPVEGSEPPTIDVRVNVREAPFQTVRAGLGGQLEQGRWVIPRGRADYTNRDFLGALRRLELSTTLGYAFVPDFGHAVAGGTGTKTGIVTLDTAQLTNPGIFPGFDLVSRGEFSREVQNGFDYYYVAARFSLLYRRGRHAIAPSMNFVRYFGTTLDTDLGTLINTGGQSLGILANNNCIPNCNLLYPELRYTYDSRDNLIETTDGFYSTLGVQQSVNTGDFAYFRVEPEVRGYFQLSRYGVFAVRAQYGAIILEGNNQNPQASPFTQRFFGGGQVYQRGYAPLQQGPKIGSGIETIKDPLNGSVALPTSRFTSWVPIGGNGATLLSAEARLRADFVFNHLAFVLFVDASRITEKPTLPWQGLLEVAPGIGLRYVTPFGPIRADVGYTVNPQTVTMPAATQSNGMTIPETLVAPACKIHPNEPCLFLRRWAYHITLGEAF